MKNKLNKGSVLKWGNITKMNGTMMGASRIGTKMSANNSNLKMLREVSGEAMGTQLSEVNASTINDISDKSIAHFEKVYANMYQEVEGYKKQLAIVKRNHDEEMKNLKDTVYKSMAGYLKVKADKVALMLTDEHQMLATRFLVFKKRTQR